ncbi:MAG: hypothetical protein WB440_21255 [Steroidobacteraceae bacterium]|jgi:ABC-type Fe3+-hydroxamate transport system substrate-binding protein
MLQGHHRTIFLCLSFTASLCTAAESSAPPPPPIGPKNGIVRVLAGSQLTFESADGNKLTVALTPDTRITAQQPATLADIKPGDFVASAAMQGADGKTHSQEVRIFPESMRGVGEGHRPMSQPNQTMTNATVSKVETTMTNATVTQVAAGVLTTTYPGGSTDLIVDPGTPVWRILPAGRDRLTPGTTVRVFSADAPDGKLTARYINILK